MQDFCKHTQAGETLWLTWLLEEDTSLGDAEINIVTRLILDMLESILFIFLLNNNKGIIPYIKN